MKNNEGTLIILNPHAGSGRAGKLWRDIEPLLWEELGELVVAITEHPEDVAEHLDKARDVGLTRIVAIGGDGTNHAIVNAIQDLEQRSPEMPRMTFAQIPIGTGQDFARTIGIPSNPRDAVRWIAHAKPNPIDLGLLNYFERGEQRRHFVNIASTGLGGDVDRRVSKSPRRFPWTFKLASLQSLMSYRPHKIRIRLDDEPWYEGKSWTVVIANGRVFGHGMNIAPQAQVDDGLFDVIVIGDVSRLRTLMAFNTVYRGTHLKIDGVHYKRGQNISIESQDGILDLDLDGEYIRGEHLQFQIKPGALRLLVNQGEM